MQPKIREHFRVASARMHEQLCNMCGGNLNNMVYEYTAPISKEVIDPICLKCAMREYYGTGYKGSKRYEHDRKFNRIFGVTLDN